MVERGACEGERKEITLKGSNRVKDTIKEGEAESGEGNNDKEN